jgi:hypothetical protein
MDQLKIPELLLLGTVAIKRRQVMFRLIEKALNLPIAGRGGTATVAPAAIHRSGD